MRSARARHGEKNADAAAVASTYAATVADREHVLVARLKTGDQEAFREAVVRFSPQMLAIARSIVGPAQAEDIVQDSWLTFLSRIKRFEERAALATWLVRIVSNRAISHLRSRAREVSSTRSNEEGDPESVWFDESGRWATPPAVWSAGSPEELLSADELQDCIDKHLESMPDQQRLVLVMRDMQQLSFEDICNELGVSASNVRVLLHRGRLRLMNMVDGFQKTGTC
jgi:RNA polymerase sigma-70 factor (ECF subfamily)